MKLKKFIAALLSIMTVVSMAVVPTNAYAEEKTTDTEVVYTKAAEEDTDFIDSYVEEISSDLVDEVLEKAAVQASLAADDKAVSKSHESDETEIVDSGNCGGNGNNVKYELHKSGTLYIYGEGGMKDYSYYYNYNLKNYYSDSPFYNKSDIINVVIESGVTSIGNDAFEDCSSLTSIEIPDSVTSIGYGAFYNCSSLTSIEIPDSVTSIGNHAFEDCSSLKDVYYTGTEEQWKKISIGSYYNSCLTSATIHYNSYMPGSTEHTTPGENPHYNDPNVIVPITDFNLESYYGINGVSVNEGETFYVSGELVIEDNSGYKEAAEKTLTDEIKKIIWSVSDPDIAEVTNVEPVERIVSIENNDFSYVEHNGINQQYSTLKIKIELTAFDEGSITLKGTTSNDIEADYSLYVNLDATRNHVTGKLESVKQPSGNDKAKIKIDGHVYDVTNKFDVSKALNIYNNYEEKMVVAILRNDKVSKVESVLDVVEPQASIFFNENSIQYKDGKYNETDLRCNIKFSAGAKSPFYDSDIKGTAAENVEFNFEKYTVNLPDHLYFKNLLSKSTTLEKTSKATVSMKNSKIYDCTVYVDTAYVPEKIKSEFKISLSAVHSNGTVDDSTSLYVENTDLQTNSQTFSAFALQGSNALAKSEFGIDYTALTKAGYTTKQIAQIDAAIKTWVCNIMAAKSFAEQDFKSNEWTKLLKGAISSENFKDYCYDAIYDTFGKLGVKIEPMAELGIGLDNIEATTTLNVLNDKCRVTSQIEVDVKFLSLSIKESKNIGSYGSINYHVVPPKGKENVKTASGSGMFTFENAATLFPTIEEWAKDQLKDAIEDSIDGIWGKLSPKNFWKKQISNAIVEIFVTAAHDRILHDSCVHYATNNYYELYSNAEKYFKKFSVHCPVDVYIYDNNDNLCGSVINNEVNIVDDSIFLYCVGDEKYFTLLNDNYTVKFVGNDTGSMKYEVREYIGSELQREIVYDDIPLESDTTYFSKIPESIGTPAEYYDLLAIDQENVITSTSENILEKEFVDESVELDSDTDTETNVDTDSDKSSDTKKDTDTDNEPDKNPTNPDKPKDPTETGKMGDLDGDGKITSADSLLILRQSVSLEHFTDFQQKLADVDGDGKITSADALEVLRYSVSLPTQGNIGEVYSFNGK